MVPNKSLTWLLAMIVIALAACSGGGKVDNEQFAFFDDMGITINRQLLLADSLTMPDIYCGDPEQTLDDLKGKKLSHEQYEKLIVPAGKFFTDEMGNWMLLGVRDMGSGITLAAFYIGSGTGYSVDLMTYDKQGHLLDAINTRVLHMLWRTHFEDVTNDTVFTLDGHLTFSGNQVTLHRIMGRCVMDFEKDLKGAPHWQQAWDQNYIINAKGHFVLQGQRIVKETGQVDTYAALDFKSWDMLVCSLYDPGIMDTWNDYSELVNTTYDPDYKYNPFPWHVEQLYIMNPKRFLSWIAAPQNRNNRLLQYFKLQPEDRPALLKEIAGLDDEGARQWFTSLVNSWDDKPLTKRL